MNEQQSIFDAGFDDNLSIRRRTLLSLAVKMYVWFFMVLGCIFLLEGLCSLFSSLVGKSDLFSDTDMLTYWIGRLILSFVGGSVLVLIGGVIWKEMKWAIRINWVFAVLTLLSLLFRMFDIRTGVISEDLTIFLPTLFFLPYWIMLYRIQKRWEQLIQTKK